MESNDGPVESINALFKKCLNQHRSTYPDSLIDIDLLNLTARISQGRDPVGRGHSSDVYQGELDKRTEIAIKMLRLPIYALQQEHAYETVFLSFFRELSHWNELQHPNIAQMLGFAFSRGNLALISLWYTHGNLSQYLLSNPDASKPDLILDIAEGLRYLHTAPHPLIHADLKAANVFINENGVACLGDFGISSQLNDLNRMTGSTTGRGAFGTTHWMAPELFLEVKFTRETDVYAMAGVFLEVYCPGKIPYHYINNEFILISSKMRGELPERMHYPELNLQCHDNLWALMYRCWNINPAERPHVKDIIHFLYEELGLKPRVIHSVASRPALISVPFCSERGAKPDAKSDAQAISSEKIPPSITPRPMDLLRQRGILEVISVTEKYLHQLELVELIAQTVRTQRPPIISPDKAAESFVVVALSGLQHFRQLLSRFLQALYLRHRLQMPLTWKIGDVLLQYVQEFADGLPQYMEGISVAEDRLKSEIRDNWKFRVLIERITRDMPGVKGKGEDILSLPAGHLEELFALLKTIITQTDPSDPDVGYARRAVALIRRSFGLGMLVTWQNAAMTKEPEKYWTWADVFSQEHHISTTEVERQKIVFEMAQMEMDYVNRFESYMKDNEYFKWSDLCRAFTEWFPEFDCVYDDHRKMMIRLHNMQRNEYPVVRSVMTALRDAALDWQHLYPSYFSSYTRAAYAMMLQLGNDASACFGIRTIVENTAELALPRLRWYLDVFLPSMEDATPLLHEDHILIAETRCILVCLVSRIETKLPGLKKRLKLDYIVTGMKRNPSVIVEFIDTHDLAETNYQASLEAASPSFKSWSPMAQLDDLVALVKHAHQQVSPAEISSLSCPDGETAYLPNESAWWRVFGSSSATALQDEWSRKMELWRNWFEAFDDAVPPQSSHPSHNSQEPPRKWSWSAFFRKIKEVAESSRR